jgi:hypothetical protein
MGDSPTTKRLKMTGVVPDALVQRLRAKQQDHVLKVPASYSISPSCPMDQTPNKKS